MKAVVAVWQTLKLLEFSGNDFIFGGSDGMLTAVATLWNAVCAIIIMEIKLTRLLLGSQELGHCCRHALKPELVTVDGGCRWRLSMAAVDGGCRWRLLMAAENYIWCQEMKPGDRR